MRLFFDFIVKDEIYYERLGILYSLLSSKLQKKNIFIIIILRPTIDRGVRLYVKYTSQKLILLLVVTYVLVCVKV